LVESGFESRNPAISRNNQQASRPFIEHQLQIDGFSVALELAIRRYRGIKLIHAQELVRALPGQTRANRNPLLLRASVSHEGKTQEIGVVLDLLRCRRTPPEMTLERGRVACSAGGPLRVAD
jgi:hypothetical protein